MDVGVGVGVGGTGVGVSVGVGDGDGVGVAVDDGVAVGDGDGTGVGVVVLHCQFIATVLLPVPEKLTGTLGQSLPGKVMVTGCDWFGYSDPLARLNVTPAKVLDADQLR